MVTQAMSKESNTRFLEVVGETGCAFDISSRSLICGFIEKKNQANFWKVSNN